MFLPSLLLRQQFRLNSMQREFGKEQAHVGEMEMRPRSRCGDDVAKLEKSRELAKTDE